MRKLVRETAKQVKFGLISDKQNSGWEVQEATTIINSDTIFFNHMHETFSKMKYTKISLAHYIIAGSLKLIRLKEPIHFLF